MNPIEGIPRGIRLLMVQDSMDGAELILVELRNAGFEPGWLIACTAGELRAALADGPWDVIVSDVGESGFTAVQALQIVREKLPLVPFIVFPACGADLLVAQAMKAGANRFVVKDRLAELPDAIARELLNVKDSGRTP